MLNSHQTSNSCYKFLPFFFTFFFFLLFFISNYLSTVCFISIFGLTSSLSTTSFVMQVFWSALYAHSLVKRLLLDTACWNTVFSHFILEYFTRTNVLQLFMTCFKIFTNQFIHLESLYNLTIYTTWQMQARPTNWYLSAIRKADQNFVLLCFSTTTY